MSAVARSLLSPKLNLPVSFDPSLVCLDQAPKLLERLTARAGDDGVGGGAGFPAAVFPEFVSEEEAVVLETQLLPLLRRRPYEDGHWDGVIKGFREAIKSFVTLSPEVMSIFNRVVHAFPEDVHVAEFVHILDLEEEGVISSHVDSVKFSGNFIVALSLLTPAVISLYHEHSDDVVRMLVPNRSLYVLSDEARYDWGHAVEAGPIEFPGHGTITKSRRVSLMFRDELVE